MNANAAKPKRSRSLSQAVSSLTGELNQVSTYGLESADVIRKFQALRNHFNLPLRDWEYLRGYRDATTNAWYRTSLIFLYGMGGRLFTWDEATKEEQAAIMANAEGATSGHYWAHNRKLYFGGPLSELGRRHLAA